MKVNIQTVTWVALCVCVAVGGATLFMALIAGAAALLLLIRRYGSIVDGLIILLLFVSIASSFRGNPPIGILIVLFSVALAAHFSKIITKGCIPENVLYLCMLVSILPLFSSNIRYSGVFENPNMFASFICSNMALFFVLGITAKAKTVIVFLVCCVCVFLSGSRSWSIVAVFFSLIVLIRVYQSVGRTIIAKMFLAVLSLVVLFFIPWVQLFNTYLGVFVTRISALAEGGDGSTMERLNNFYIAINAIVERPLLGDGISGFYILSGERYHSHSTILELLVSFGLVVGSFFVVFMLVMSAELVLKSRYYRLKRLEGMGIAFYLFLFLFFDSILSNVLALTVMFSLLALSPRWSGIITRSVFDDRRNLNRSPGSIM